MAASRLATNLLLLVYRVRLQAHLRPRCAGDIARGPKRLVTLADYVKCDNERTALAIYKGSTGECAEAPFGHFEGFAMGLTLLLAFIFLLSAGAFAKRRHNSFKLPPHPRVRLHIDRKH